jgi:hypothetical protein
MAQYYKQEFKRKPVVNETPIFYTNLFVEIAWLTIF